MRRILTAFASHSPTLGLLLLCAIGAGAAAARAATIEIAPVGPHTGVTLGAQSPQGIELRFRMSAFGLEPVVVDGEPMQAVTLPGVLLPNEAGAPDLPALSRFVAVPRGAVAEVTLTAAERRVYPDLAIAPAPVLPRENEDGPPVYARDAALYGRDAHYPVSPVVVSAPRKLRGVDVVMVGVTPFQYNPVTRELVVYTDLTVRVDFRGGDGRFGEDRLRSRHWEPLLRERILNYASLSAADVDAEPDPGRYGWEYVIVCPDDPVFTAWADSLRSWRTLQGISTQVFTTTQTGSTAAQIEAWLNNAYATWAVPPAAFLILGDYPDSGERTPGVTSPVWDSYCVSDNIYADVDGDGLPDMAHGRICARTGAELATMVGKMLAYERAPYADAGFYDHPLIAGGWQTERWFILCTEVVLGHQEDVLGKHPVREYAIYQGTPGSVWSSNSNTQTVVDYFGPSGLGYIPATPQHLLDWGGNAERINNDLNAGAYLLLHRDHGWVGGWGEPSYGITNLAGLHNDMLPFVFTINCLTGKYNGASACFAEAFHRMDHGALGLIAPSEVSYSFVNDTFVWGLFDGLWPGFMPAQAWPELPCPGEPDGRTAFGMVAGKYFLAASAWPYNQDSKEVTYHLFHHHGDAFMTLASEVPRPLEVWHYDALPLGSSAFAVRAAAGALVGLTVDGVLIGAATATGATQAIPVTPQYEPGTLRITVTKVNHYRYDEAVPISGTAYTVAPDGSGDYPTVQAAIQAATPGVIIELTDGVFRGPGNRDLDYLGKAIEIRSRGADPAVCVIDCQGSQAVPHRGFHLHSGETAASRLAGVTVRGGSHDPGGAICCEGAALSAANCIFESGEATAGGAVDLHQSQDAIFTECIFRQNAAYAGSGGAVHLSEASAAFAACTFVANSGWDGAAIQVDGGAAHCTGCTFHDNPAGAPGGGQLAADAGAALVLDRTIVAHAASGAVHAPAGTSAALGCCDLYGNAGGDWVGPIAGQLGLNGNISADPIFCDAGGGVLDLHSLSPCAPAANPACGLIGARPVGCWPAIMEVAPDGTGDYPTIQAAIDASLYGDIVTLAAGTFSGPGNRDIDFRGKSITVRSRSGDPAGCTIDAQGSPSEPHRAFDFHSGEGALAVVENITLSGGRADAGGAIRCVGAAPALTGVIFRNNDAGTGGGLYCADGAPLLEGCGFVHNAADDGAAIACGDGAQPLVRRCTLADNHGRSGAGAVACGDGALVTFDRSILAFATQGPAVACSGSGTAQLACCDLFGNAGGDWVGCVAGQLGVSDNFTGDPLFCDRPFDNYMLTDTSPCAPEASPACGRIGAWPVGCVEPYIVYPDGSGEYPTIQAAIDAASDGIIIRLADGVFTGDGNRDLDFGGKAITLSSLSGRPETCILDCQGSATEMHRAFRFHSGEEVTSIVQGITVRGGYQTYGGAIHLQGSACTVRNCVFAGNSAVSFGGAIYAYYHSAIAVDGCTFAGNTAALGAAVHCHSYSQAEILSSIVAFNLTGDGVHCYFNSGVTLSCCDLFGNQGGDYVSCAQGLLGLDGNISEDPRFCDAAAGNFGLWNTSPCAPGNVPAVCLRMGALDVLCEGYTSAGEGPAALPAALHLTAATPAGPSARTRIDLALPGPGPERVDLRIYDPSGRLVRALIGGLLPPGHHQIEWDGRDDGGQRAASGVYYCRVTAGDRALTRPLVVLR